MISSFRVFQLGALIFLSGCVTTRSQLRMGARTQDGSAAPVAEALPPKAQAVVVEQQMEQGLRELNGRIEVLENEVQQLRLSHGSMTQGSAKEVDDLRLRLKLFEEALVKFEQNLASLGMELQEMKVARASSHSAASSSSKGSDRGDSFDLAEESYRKREWRQAILEYQKYREKNPKGKRYSEATLKIGLSFAELNMKSEARAFFEEVVAKFPQSASAKTASQKLKDLK